MTNDQIIVETNAQYFEFLEVLRKSGATNMFGAGSYLQEEFGMDRRAARDIVLAWMKSYEETK